MLENSERGEAIRAWHWALFILLQMFNLYQVLHHSMWRDELQIWSLVRESGTLPELLHNMRYDGFPPLWYICLWFFSLFTSSSLAMQLFHFACSLAAQFLVLIRAPFSVGTRLAIIAGYYISFEYCIISRAYVLGVLLIFIACAFRSWLATRPLARAVIWGALANTSVYGAILSLAFVCDEVLHFIGEWRRRGSEARNWKGVVAFLALYAIFLVTAVACMLPPPDGNFSEAWRLQPSINELIYLFFRNLAFFIPIPLVKPAFWNTLALIDFSAFQRWMIIPSGIMIMSLVWLTLRPSRRYLRLFLIGFGGIWIFTVIKYDGYLRHVGAEMVLFLACIWLAAVERHYGQKIPAASRRAFCLILVLNIMAFGIASYYHLQYEFSGSRQMANTIRNLGAGRPIVADVDSATSSVAGYLNMPFYYPANRKAETYIRWNRQRTGGGVDDAFAYARELAAGRPKGVLLLFNYPVDAGPVRFLARTPESIVADEVFYLYEYKP